MNLDQNRPNDISRSSASSRSRDWIKQNFWSLMALAAVIGICAFIVQHFKKPGQMSVIESQAMDMSAMQPPRGAVPVAIATVERETIEGSVTYTGTVQAYEDEDVFPRLTGRIVSMPVYPGDTVKKGQLLVQLDPTDRSEYASKLSESRYASEAAMNNASIARQELSEKSYELEAAKFAESAAADELQQAKSDLEYWSPEIKREVNLLKGQVISQQEYDDELNKYNQASAKVRQLVAKQNQAKSTRLAANAAYEAAAHHVGHIAFAAREAEAATLTADITHSYTRIQAQSDGVVVKRLVSPGVVVNPGMLILKISHLKKVRVQAEVASVDADKITVGNTVYIKSSELADDQIEANITSIFPAADVSTRTVIVEALVDNTGPRLSDKGSSSRTLPNLSSFRLLPGDYVVMRISTGKENALVIPSSAVVWREGKSQVWRAVGSGGTDDTKYTCVMHPQIKADKPGKCPICGMTLVPMTSSGNLSAHLTAITTGVSDDQNTEVTSGLSEGDQIIYQGYSSLENGLPVIATEWGESGPVTLPTVSKVQTNRLDSDNKWTNDIKLEGMHLHLIMLPQPPKGSNNKLRCTILSLDSKAVIGASISAKTTMPAMSMPGPDLSAIEKGKGNYELTTNFMSGLWQIILRVNNQTTTINVDIP